MRVSYFVVHRDQFGRLATWFQFFPPEEATVTDRVLAGKFYRGQFNPTEQTIPVSKDEVTRVRLWFDYVSDAAVDLSDEDYAERLDAFMARAKGGEA